MFGSGSQRRHLPTSASAAAGGVSAFLLDGRLDSTVVGALIEAGLASQALRALDETKTLAGSADTPVGEMRSGLGRSRLTALAGHAAVRSAVGPLLRAWRLAGLEVLVFKGFHLAENVYPDAADRAYSDVDVALRPGGACAGMDPEELAAVAAQVASQAGWRVVWRYGEDAAAGSLHDERYDGHELLQIVHRKIGIGLDVHRRIVHNNVNVARASASAERITTAVWDASVVADVAGARVRVPTHLDSALVGLIAARSWSSDRHAIRPHDYLDLEQLMAADDFGRDSLLSRARQLGMYRTAIGFLRRCDPTNRVLKITSLGRAGRLMLDLGMLPERWPRGLALAWRRLERLAEEALAALRVLPVVQGVVRDHRSGKSFHVGGERDAGRVLEPDRRTWTMILVGVRRSLQVLGIDPSDHPALALDCLSAVAERARLTVTRVQRAAMVSFECDGEPLPLTLLGNPAGATRTRWPAETGSQHA